MKKFRLIIVVLLIVGALGYLYYDTSNETVEDVLTQDAAVGSLSAPERIIDSFTQDNVIMCIYQTTDGRLGYATIECTDRSYNKYSVCTNENIDDNMLTSQKSIVKTYNQMGFDYVYGIVVNPTGDSFSHDNNTYTLHTCNYNNIKIGCFLENL